MSYPTNPINVYVCQTCQGVTVTVDREEGVTPFQIRCRAFKDCTGTALSGFYQVPQDLAPQYEWRKPTKTEYYQLDVATREQHVDRGGLLLYPIKSAVVALPVSKEPEKPKPQRASGRKRRELKRANSRELVTRFAEC